jgi:plasmid stabilization system protein ParE
VKLIVSYAATADVERLRLFLKDKDPTAAQRVVVALDNAIRSLTIFPERGRPSGIAGARDLIVPFGRSAYILRYRYSSRRDEIVIFRIWHGRESRD